MLTRRNTGTKRPRPRSAPWHVARTRHSVALIAHSFPYLSVCVCTCVCTGFCNAAHDTAHPLHLYLLMVSVLAQHAASMLRIKQGAYSRCCVMCHDNPEA